MIKEELLSDIKGAVKNLVLKDILPKESMELIEKSSLSTPKNPKLGDFFSNAALVLGQGLKKNPLQISVLLKEEILKTSRYFKKIEVASAGFINFTLNDEALLLIIKNIINLKEEYGKTIQENPKNILIEFVSANPTGGLHLGHARPAFMGDAVARLLKAAGFLVTKEFYVNDAGNQVEVLARTIYKRYLELYHEKIEILPNEYPSEQIIDIAKALKAQDGDKWLNQPEHVWLKEFIKFGVDFNLSLIKDSLDRVSIKMDKWFYEKTLYKNGALEELIKAYKNKGMVYEAQKAQGQEEKIRREESKASKFSHLQEGGLFLKTSLYGDDEDRIIQRKDGRFVYLAADLAYHKEKFERGFDLLINVFGADHSGHVARISAGMQALGYEKEKLKFILVQIVRLLKDGQEVKLSKRRGEVTSLDDLVLEIGSDAARFIFLMRSHESQFDFDIKSVLSKTQDNPVFYIQYGHARMATILKKAQDKIDFDPNKHDINDQVLLSLPEERQLILKVLELPYVIREAANHFEPHRLIFYCQEIIKIFHSYFTKYRHSEKIITDDIKKTGARLVLIYVLKQTLHNALTMIGISAPDYMESLEG